MVLAFIILFFVLVLLFFLCKQKNLNIKAFMIVLFVVAVVFSLGICIKQPKMHNRISLNIIDYLVKFNQDGSMTTTKQVTTEVIKEMQK